MSRVWAVAAPLIGTMRRASRTTRFLPLAAVWACLGCDTAGWSSGGQVGYRPADRQDEIVAVRSFYSLLPWVRDPDGAITGFRVRTYFVSGRTDKGEFVPGDIHVTLNTLERRPDGALERQRLHEWVFPEREAAGFRVLKRAVGGDSYGFVLQWPAGLEVMGRTVEITTYYHRSDGRFIYSPPRQFRVPLPFGQIAPRTPATPAATQPGAPSPGARGG